MTLLLTYCARIINKVYKDLFTELSLFFFRFHNFIELTVLSSVVWKVDWWVIRSVENFYQFVLNVALAAFLLSVILVKEWKSLRELFKMSMRSNFCRDSQFSNEPNLNHDSKWVLNYFAEKAMVLFSESLVHCFEAIIASSVSCPGSGCSEFLRFNIA